METREKLHAYIDDFCHSQAKIARRLNKNPVWLSNILSGKTRLKYEDFKNICSVMGTDINRIEEYGDTDEES